MGLLYELIILIYASNGHDYTFLDLKIKLNSNTFDKDWVESIKWIRHEKNT